MNKNKLTGLTIVLVFGAIISFIMFTDKRLESNGILLNARTTEWIMGANMSMDLKYEFYYEGRKIIGSNATGNYRGNPLFVNKYFPVIYDLKYERSELLVQPANFKKYNLVFPDSLNWVLQYIK